MVTRESRGGGLKQKRREESLLHLSVYLQTLGGFVMVSLRPSERSSWENLATEKERSESGRRRRWRVKRDREEKCIRWTAPLVFCEGETLHNVY